MNLNLQWIKLSCMALGAMALLALMATTYSPVHASAQQPSWPYSPYTLVISASGSSCHTGGMQVQPGTSFTAQANGNTIPVHLDSMTHTATFPTLPNNTWASIQVPAHTDLSLKDCNGYINVSGITGQMDISASGGITAGIPAQVRLLGNSHLNADNKGSITFNGSLDSNSNDLFDGSNNTQVTLPKSDSFHIDATTNANGSISTNLGTPTPYGSFGSQLHVSSQSAPGALLTVKQNSYSIEFNVV